MNKVRNLIFLALLAFLFVEVLIIFPNYVDRKEKPSSNSTEAQPAQAGPTEQKVQGLNLSETQNGRRDREVIAEMAEGSQTTAWKVTKVKVLFYANEKLEFTVTGEEGNVDMKTKNMSIRGHVVTTSANGYIFRTQEVEYDATARRIVSPSQVLMLGPKDRDGEGMKVEGNRMQVDVDTSKMTIMSDVRAKKDLNGGRRLNVISESAEFSGQNKQARFIGNVLMEYDRVKLEGPEASFLSSEKGDFLSNIRFSGGIKVSDADKFATSENLNLDLVANKFVFTGRPKVYQNNDELSGEQIIFLEGGKKVKVERVKARVENADTP